MIDQEKVEQMFKSITAEATRIQIDFASFTYCLALISAGHAKMNSKEGQSASLLSAQFLQSGAVLGITPKEMVSHAAVEMKKTDAIMNGFGGNA